jgi:hypothetical protein
MRRLDLRGRYVSRCFGRRHDGRRGDLLVLLGRRLLGLEQLREWFRRWRLGIVGQLEWREHVEQLGRR